MADSRYKLTNATKYNIGFFKPGKVEENIQPGRFVFLTEDEIKYEAFCMELWLRSGELVAEDPAVYAMFGINKDEAIVCLSDDEIREKFKAPLKAFSVWLSELNGSAVKRRVFDVACRTDTLPIKRIELIEKATGFSVQDYRKHQGGDE